MATKVKEIPKRNYIILIGLMVLVVCACFAFYNVHNIMHDNIISESPLANKEITLEDLNDASIDMAANTFFVISYKKDEKVYDNEKGIKKLLNKYNLMDNVVYLDVTDLMLEEDYLDKINNSLNLKDSKAIKKVPAVIYYDESEPVLIIDSTDHLLYDGDFQRIIDSYELAS